LLVLQHLVKHKIQVPAGAILNSAFTDLSLSGESYNTNTYNDFVSNIFLNTRLCQWIIGKNVMLTDPRVSPLFGDFENLPPLYFFAGADEILLSDTLRAA